MATPRWGGLRLEPYKANAVDADGDGIVQEGTAWERPAATTLVDNLNRPIRDGITSPTRPQGMRVVDRDGKDVKYKPTYGTGPTSAKEPGAVKQTPLAQHGAPSLREMGVLSLKDMGLPTVEQITQPKQRDDQQSNRLSVSVPEIAEFNGEKAQVNGFGNPRFQEWKKRVEAAYGGTVRGEPISVDDPMVPDFVYHVTPAFRAIEQSRRIQAGGKGGLGGDDRDRIVSMTVNEDIARDILADMRLVRDVASSGLEGDDLLDYFKRLAESEKVDISDSSWKSIAAQINTNGAVEGLKAYMWSRDLSGGRRNPLFFGLSGLVEEWKSNPPSDDDLQIVKIPKKNLRTGAQLTNFDVGQGYLEEIRLYGDVPFEDASALPAEDKPLTELPVASPVPNLIDSTRVDTSIPTPESFDEFENYIDANFDDLEVESPEWFDEVNNWLRDTMIPSGKWSDTVQNQIENYRARWYIGINDGLRRGESNPNPEMQEYLMSSKLPEGLKIYRGTSYWDEDAPYLDEGDTFTDRAFQSFSAKPRDLATEGVGRLSDIQIVATLGPNVRGANIGGFENEVLLPAGIKYRIDEITEDERGKPIWNVTILEQGEGVDFGGGDASVSTNPDQEKPSYNLPIIPGQVLPTQMFDEPNMEKVRELLRTTSDVDQQLQRMVATAFYTNDFSWIIDQIAIDATSNSELGGDPMPVEGVSLADIRYLAEMWREDAQRGLERIADQDGMITVYRGGRVGGVEHGPVSVSLSRETAAEYGDPIEYRIPISAIEYEPQPNDYEEYVVNPSLMTPVNPEGEQQLQEDKDSPLSYPKPQYPRQPPAAAFTGRAEELFGSAASWDEFKQILDQNEVIFLDYETTGLDWDEFGQVRSNGEPTQIGAVKMVGGKVVDRFNIYINPGVPHAEWQEWSRLNLRDADGNLITQQFLEDKPSIKDAHDLFTQWAGPNAILGMQNAVFDDEILTRSLVAGGNDWRPAGILDTKEIADMVLPKWNPETRDGPIKHDQLGNVVLDANGNPIPSNSLGDITRYLGVELGERHHTADFDAIATGESLTKIVDGAIEKGWSTDVLDSTKRRAKEKANQDKYNEEIEKFLEAAKLYKAQNNPTWESVAEILDWDVFGFGEMSDEDKEADGLFEVWNEVIDDWNQWDPCREMRRSAYDLAGLTPGPADPNLGRVGGFFGNGWQAAADDAKRVEQARYLMASLANAVNSDISYERPTLYRAVALGKGEEEPFFSLLKPKQQVDIPLLAFADRRAQGDNEYLSRFGSDVLLVLEESPGSVMAGQFQSMYDATNEREMLDTLSDVLDEMEGDVDPDDEGYIADLVMNVRDLIDRYEATSINDRDERQQLRDEIGQAIKDSIPDVPVRWAGEEIPEEDSSLYWAAFDDPDAAVANTPRERISGGRMEVIAVEDDVRGTYKKVVRLRQIAAFDPQEPGRLIGRKP